MNLKSRGDHNSKSNYLYTELTKGREHAEKLQIDLNMPASSTETQEQLTHKKVNFDDEALSHNAGMEIRRSESPCFKDSNHKDVSRQKKSSSSSSIDKWKEQVKVSLEIGLDVPPDDGYMWRKYGQKEILNAKYPRGYYRCTYRDTHGCCTTKQVQRSSDDPSIFEITYLGKHTCPKIERSIEPSESSSGLINFSSTITPNSFQLSNWPHDHN